MSSASSLLSYLSNNDMESYDMQQLTCYAQLIVDSLKSIHLLVSSLRNLDFVDKHSFQRHNTKISNVIVTAYNLLTAS